LIEIKHRWNGKVLYAAKTAKDVRSAVIEARRGGADLGGANLRGANLGGANLGGANLWGADLGGANLWGADLGEANLGGANLWGADLGEANLGGADLGGANLRGANLGEANLGGANLWGANLWGADLGEANLRGANLGEANLRGANLREADLRGANLGEANLWGANLGEARGFAPERVNDLLILLDQVGPIRAYKLVDSEYRSPIQSSGKLTYRVGDTVKAKADTDPNVQCGRGVNVATLPWCLSNWRSGYRILVCEFKRSDIAAIPVGDGKFRVGKCKVVREIDQDQIYEWLGLTPDTPERESAPSTKTSEADRRSGGSVQ